MTAKEAKDKPASNHGARFYLRGPRDMLRKACHDLSRLKCAEDASAGEDVLFAALDCAISVASLRDWTSAWCVTHAITMPDFGQVTYFRLVQELANGAKHFSVDRAPLGSFKTGAVFLEAQFAAQHFLWVGFEGDTIVVRPMFEAVIAQIEVLLDDLGVD